MGALRIDRACYQESPMPEKSFYVHQGTNEKGEHVYLKIAVITSAEPLPVKDFEMQGGEMPDLYADPRYLTATEMINRAFGIPQVTLHPHGDILREYTSRAGDPFRNEYEESRVHQLRAQLEALGMGNLRDIMPREQP